LTRYERQVATLEIRIIRWAICVTLHEHLRNEDTLEKGCVESNVAIMRKRRLEWFRHVTRSTRRDIRAGRGETSKREV